jgi:TolB-like protein
MRRKLAAIVMADVAGYSRLMERDEAGTHASFQHVLRDRVLPAARRHRGRVVKTAGDGILMSFDSAVEAVTCAVALREGIEGESRRAPRGSRLRFRFGIHVGDVIVQGDDIVGGGVNLASRIQALAKPDDVLVSQAAFEQVKGSVTFGFEDLGEHRVKNIRDPVHVYRVATTVPAAAAPDATGSPVPSVAVLPFVNLSGDAEQLYFSDGMTEDIITELSRFRTIAVIARNSTFVYRGKSVDVAAVRDDLGVQFVVEGSIRRLGDRVRITVQLINAETRHHVWAERYDVPVDGIFGVQDDVTRRVVAGMLPRIETEGLAIARRRPTGDIRAYDFYLRGKAAYHAATDGRAMAGAERHFLDAVALDPEFVGANCYLARINNLSSMYTAAGRPLAPLRARALAYAQRAAAVDPNDPHVCICLAWCHLWRREFAAARRQLEQAEVLNPNDADRLVDCGTTRMYLGECDRAIALIDGAIALNPHHPDSYLGDLAEVYFVAGRDRDMLALAERIAEPSPQFPAWKAAAYAWSGQAHKARASAAAFVEGVRAIWSGDPAATEEDYVDWLVAFNPFRRRRDLRRLLDGLAKAGLPRGGGTSGQRWRASRQPSGALV